MGVTWLVPIPPMYYIECSHVVFAHQLLFVAILAVKFIKTTSLQGRNLIAAALCLFLCPKNCPVSVLNKIECSKSVDGLYLYFSVSILVFVLIAILVVSEVRYYSSTDLKYSYEVDTDYES